MVSNRCTDTGALFRQLDVADTGPRPGPRVCNVYCGSNLECIDDCNGDGHRWRKRQFVDGRSAREQTCVVSWNVGAVSLCKMSPYRPTRDTGFQIDGIGGVPCGLESRVFGDTGRPEWDAWDCLECCHRSFSQDQRQNVRQRRVCPQRPTTVHRRVPMHTNLSGARLVVVGPRQERRRIDDDCL